MKFDRRKAFTMGLVTSMLLAFIFIASNVNVAPASLQFTTLEIDPSSLTVSPCHNFTVAVNVKNVTDLYAWQFNVTFDPSLMQCLFVIEGPFLKDWGATAFAHIIDNVGGWVAAACTLLMPPGRSGSGTLAYIMFHCEGPGESPLHIKPASPDTMLIDSDGNLIPFDPIDGFVTQYAPTPKYLHGEDGIFYGVRLHAEYLINLASPICTYWHELWPYYCSHKYHLNSWEDNGDNMLTPSDQIDMIDTQTEEKTWWHVDEVTVTILVQLIEEPIPSMYLEFMGGFQGYVGAIVNPIGTDWHEVYPVFSPKYYVEDWSDNGDGILSYCDKIYLVDSATGIGAWYHIEQVATDIIVTRKPVCTKWHEIYPEFCANSYHLSSWIDNGDHELGYCDKIDLTDMATGAVSWWHVESVTITLILTEKFIPVPEPMYIELSEELPALFDPALVLTQPICTIWHEIWPLYCRYYHLTSWEDANADGWLSPSDQIDMTDEFSEVHWYHVDDISIDIWITPLPQPVHDVAVIDVAPQLTSVAQGQSVPIDVTVENQGDYAETVVVRAEADPDPATSGDEIPIGTEIISLDLAGTSTLGFVMQTPQPVPPGTYTISAEADPVPGEIDTADNKLVDGTVTVLPYLNLHGEDGLLYGVRLHADPPVLIDLTTPICTYWHELWPYYCNIYHLNSWRDNGDRILSPSDQIDMVNMETYEKTWWHVDDITITLYLTPKEPGDEPMYVEFDIGWEGYEWVLKDPIGLRLHEIWPVFCRYFTLTSWEDTNGNGWIDPSDQIDIMDMDGVVTWWHVREVATDIILSRKPVCTQWHEIFPRFCANSYHLSSWRDNGDHKLSYCDIIDLTNKKTGKITWWHVIRVTITIVVTDKVEPLEPLYFDFMEDVPVEQFPLILANPICTPWHEIWPVYSRERHLTSWIDTNGNGWLDPSDQIDMTPINFPGTVEWYHVEDVMIDIWLEPVTMPCPPRVEWTRQFGPIDYFMTFCPSPGVADLVDNDPQLEIVTGTDEWHGWQKWHCFDHVGGYEWTLPTTCDESRTSVAIGDMDYDGDLEIAGGTTSGWQTQVFDHTGNFVWRYPSYDWWHSSPAMCDVNPYTFGLEVIAAEYFSGKVYCFAVNGSILWTFQTNGKIDASPACGDIDNDGVMEVVISAFDQGNNPHYIYAINGITGALEWQHWIQQPSTCSNRGVHSSAALADIDNDEVVEVIFGANDGGVRCLRGTDGTLKWTYWTCGSVYSSPAVGDVDADGVLEIIVGSNDHNVYCLSAVFGVPVLEWRYLTRGAVVSSAALANRGGVGLGIYIGSMDSRLYALDGFGNLIWDFPTGATNGITSSPAVADIDGDEKLEVMFTDWNAIPDDAATTNIFWVLEDCTSQCLPYAIEWAMFRHDRCHTGKYTSGILGMAMAAIEDEVAGGSIKPLVIMTHDVTVVFDWLSKAFITAGEVVDVYVTVENQGDYAEQATVTVTYDGTFIGSDLVSLNPGEEQTLTFPWDTTGVPQGAYLVTADISIVPGEIDTMDNTFSTLAIIKDPVHDVAVASVTSAKTVVCQGNACPIEITVFNQGDYPETFVLGSAATPLFGPVSPGSIGLVTLNPSEAKTVTLLWYVPEDLPKGPYWLGGYIVAPIAGETDLADNTLTGSVVTVTMLGDITGLGGIPDGKCDMRDIGMAARNFGKTVPPAPADCDLTGVVRGVPDGKVDMRDIGMLAREFGKKDP